MYAIFFFLHQVYILVVNSVMFTASVVRNPVLFLNRIYACPLSICPAMLDKGRQSSLVTGHSNTPNSWQIPLKHKTDSSGDNVRWYISMTDPSLEAQGVQPQGDRINDFLIVGPDTSIQSSLWKHLQLAKQENLNSFRFKSISSQMSPDSTEGMEDTESSCLCWNWKVISLSSRWLELLGEGSWGRGGGLGGWALNAGVAGR